MLAARCLKAARKNEKMKIGRQKSHFKRVPGIALRHSVLLQFLVFFFN